MTPHRPPKRLGYEAFGSSFSLPTLDLHPALAAASIPVSGSVAFPYQFSTKRPVFLDETGTTRLYDFGARWYDPSVGRFLSPDPAGFGDGPNLYLYAKNAPTLFIDADGETAFTIAGLLVAGGGVAGGVFEVAAELRNPGDASFGDLAQAFGRGFLSGAAATGAALVFKNPVAGGAVAGTVSNLLNSMLTGEFSTVDLGFEVAINGLTGGQAAKIPGLRLVGRRPYLTKVRGSFRQLGKNSFRLFGQQAAQDVLAGATIGIWEAFRESVGSPKAPSKQSRKPIWMR